MSGCIFLCSLELLYMLITGLYKPKLIRRQNDIALPLCWYAE